MKVIFDGTIGAAYERYFDTVVGSRPEDFVLVDVNVVEDDGDRRTERKGLEIAKKYADDPANIVILMSFESEDALRRVDPRFSGLMCYQNVGFLRLPPPMPDLVKLYEDLKAGKKSADALGKELYGLEYRDRRVATLRHDLYHAERDATRMSSWIEEAKEAGFVGSNEEIIAAVKNWERKTAAKLAGKYFPGVFVDLHGTLLDDGRRLNQRVAAKAEAFAEDVAMKASITIITDSDTREASEVLRKLGIGWRIASKFDLRGAELEIVIDDLSEEEFRKQYGISSRTFINTSEI